MTGVHEWWILQGMNKSTLLVLVLCCLGIGYLSALGGIDDVSVWVYTFVEPVAWTDIYKPVPLLFPMNDFVFRPVSIFLMKLGLWLSDGQRTFPAWLIGGKAFSVSLFFAWSTVLWLGKEFSEKEKLGIAIVALLSPQSLFSAYNFSEFDILGAGTILLCSWALEQKKSHRLWIFAAMCMVTFFLKESCCFILGCVLFPQFWKHRRDWAWLKGPLIVVGISAFFWLLGTGPLVLGKIGSVGGKLALIDRLPVAWWTLLQFIALWTEMGIVGLLIYWSRNHAWSKILTVSLLASVMMRPMILLNHYETLYFSRPWYIAGLFLLWTVGLLREVQSNHNPFWSLMAQRIFCLMGFFVVVICISSNLREDLASRLFLPLLPGMLGMSWQGLKRLWKEYSDNLFWSTVVLVVGLSHLWGVLIPSWNWSQKVRHEFAYNIPMLEQVITHIQPNAAIYVTDPQRRYDLTQMQQLSVSVDLSNIHFEPLCYFPITTDASRFLGCMEGMRYGNHIAEKMMVIDRGTRTQLSQNELQQLQGDFSWIRGPEGRGAHMPISIGDPRCADHSLLEDIYLQEYPTEMSQLEGLLINHFTPVELFESQYYTMPNRMLEIPFRLLSGISIVEPKYFHQHVWIWAE